MKTRVEVKLELLLFNCLANQYFNNPTKLLEWQTMVNQLTDNCFLNNSKVSSNMDQTPAEIKDAKTFIGNRFIQLFNLF